MSMLAIVEAFRELPDRRRGAGRRHDQAPCLPLFTLAVSAGCRGFLQALARNLALNLYRDHGFDNMAQAQRKAGDGLGLLKSLFRMKQPWPTHVLTTTGFVLVKLSAAAASVDFRPQSIQTPFITLWQPCPLEMTAFTIMTISSDRSTNAFTRVISSPKDYKNLYLPMCSGFRSCQDISR